MSDLIERMKSAKRKIEAYVSFYRPKGMGKTTLWRVHDCVTEAAAEIASLRSQLGEARRDALEEAAKVAEDYKPTMSDDWWFSVHKQHVAAHTSRSVASAIRSLSQESLDA